MIKTKSLMEYSLLIKTYDNRPIWMQNLGIYSIILNDEILERNYKRLGYKRKFGSYVCNPYDPKLEEIESVFTKNLEELLTKDKQGESKNDR